MIRTRGAALAAMEGARPSAVHTRQRRGAMGVRASALAAAVAASLALAVPPALTDLSGGTDDGQGGGVTYWRGARQHQSPRICLRLDSALSAARHANALRGSGATTATPRLSSRRDGLWIPQRAGPPCTTARLTAREHKPRVLMIALMTMSP
jgi:hypothetical protein